MNGARMPSRNAAAADTTRRTSATYGLGSGLLGAGALTVSGLLAAHLGSAWRAFPLAGLRTGVVSSDTLAQAVELPLVLVGTALAAWWGLSLLLLAALCGVRTAGSESRTLLRWIHAVAPAFVRRLTVVGVGAGLALSAVPAQAAETVPDLGWTSTVTTVGSAPTDDGLTTGFTNPGADRSDPGPSPAPVDGPEETVSPVAVPVEEAATPAPSPPAPSPSHTPVVVQAGDSLWSVAASHLPDGATDAQIAEAWPRWYDANRDVVGDDPDLVRAGTVLVTPDQADDA
jgi:resuscitation-promoting factor RpfA